MATRKISPKFSTEQRTLLAYGAKKQGAKDLPKDILPDNVALIEANEAELMKLNQELEAHDTNK